MFRGSIGECCIAIVNCVGRIDELCSIGLIKFDGGGRNVYLGKIEVERENNLWFRL